jgi:hypothetical protein
MRSMRAAVVRMLRMHTPRSPDIFVCMYRLRDRGDGRQRPVAVINLQPHV